MSFISAVVIALVLLFGGHVAEPVSVQAEADAYASLEARGMPKDHVNATCAVADARYVDSGEHGTTQEGQFSVWSVSDPDLFHHFTCKP